MTTQDSDDIDLPLLSSDGRRLSIDSHASNDSFRSARESFTQIRDTSDAAQVAAFATGQLHAPPPDSAESSDADTEPLLVSSHTSTDSPPPAGPTRNGRKWKSWKIIERPALVLGFGVAAASFGWGIYIFLVWTKVSTLLGFRADCRADHTGSRTLSEDCEKALNMSLHLPSGITRRWEEVVLYFSARGSQAMVEGYLTSIVIAATVLMITTIGYHCIGARKRNIAKNMQLVETSSPPSYHTGEAMTTGYELTKPGSTRPEGGLRWRKAAYDGPRAPMHMMLLEKKWGAGGWADPQSMPKADPLAEERKQSRPETDSHRLALNAQHSIEDCPFATEDPDECRRLIEGSISRSDHCWVVRDGATSYFRNLCTEGMIQLFKKHSISEDLKQRLTFCFLETETGTTQARAIMQDRMKDPIVLYHVSIDLQRHLDSVHARPKLFGDTGCRPRCTEHTWHRLPTKFKMDLASDKGEQDISPGNEAAASDAMVSWRPEDFGILTSYPDSCTGL